MLTVLLGAAYTFSPTRRVALEVALVLVLGGSWLGAVALLLYVHPHGQRRGRASDPTKRPWLFSQRPSKLTFSPH